LISKRVNTKDKRRVLLAVTPEGRSLLNKLVEVQAPVNDALFDTLTAKEFLPLKDIMARLVPCAARSLTLLAYLTAEKTGTN
jgi:DNA-binding MarR family transcriptional regulator